MNHSYVEYSLILFFIMKDGCLGNVIQIKEKQKNYQIYKEESVNS